MLMKWRKKPRFVFMLLWWFKALIKSNKSDLNSMSCDKVIVFIKLYIFGYPQLCSCISNKSQPSLLSVRSEMTLFRPLLMEVTMPDYSLLRLSLYVLIAIVTCSAVGLFTYAVVSMLGE